MLALDVTQLNKTYTNGVRALHDFSLKIQPGEFLGLLGPNGAGKTTLIGILNSLVIKSSGHVSVYGHDIDQAFGQAKACIGTVPQEFNFPVFERVQDIVINQGGFLVFPILLPKSVLKNTSLCLIYGKSDIIWLAHYQEV